MQHVIFESGKAQQSAEDAEEGAWLADLIAQAYLKALRHNVPNDPDDFSFVGMPLNLSERMLLFHIRELNEMLCEFARVGRWYACEELWDQALNLVGTFCEIALKNPEPFKSKARISLMMPALRVPPVLRKSKRSKEKWIDPFVGDSPEIARVIELSADTIGAKISDNRKRLGGLCARLVGECCVNDIKRARGLWSHFFAVRDNPIVWPTKSEIEPFASKTFDELIVDTKLEPSSETGTAKRYIRFFCLLGDCGVKRLHFLLLPKLTRENAKVWWKNAIEKMVEARFPNLLLQPVWVRELRAVSSGTEADMLKELKD